MKSENYFIENRTTGSQGHECYWDRGQRVSVTMVAVHMWVKETGMQTGHVHTISSELGMRAGIHITIVEQSEKH